MTSFRWANRGDVLAKSLGGKARSAGCSTTRRTMYQPARQRLQDHHPEGLPQCANRGAAGYRRSGPAPRCRTAMLTRTLIDDYGWAEMAEVCCLRCASGNTGPARDSDLSEPIGRTWSQVARAASWPTGRMSWGARWQWHGVRPTRQASAAVCRVPRWRSLGTSVRVAVVAAARPPPRSSSSR